MNRVANADYLQLITSEYQNSPKLLSWLNGLLTLASDITTLTSNLEPAFDIDLAVGAQLTTLGVIIGLPREITNAIPGMFFSWYDGHSPTEDLGWGYGSWRGPTEKTESMTLLPDDAYRQILKFKIIQNKWDGSVNSLYQAWYEIFSADNLELRIADYQDMSMTLFVSGPLIPATVQYILLGNYIPLKPTGVALDYVFTIT